MQGKRDKCKGRISFALSYCKRSQRSIRHETFLCAGRRFQELASGNETVD